MNSSSWAKTFGLSLSGHLAWYIISNWSKLKSVNTTNSTNGLILVSYPQKSGVLFSREKRLCWENISLPKYFPNIDSKLQKSAETVTTSIKPALQVSGSAMNNVKIMLSVFTVSDGDFTISYVAWKHFVACVTLWKVFSGERTLTFSTRSSQPITVHVWGLCCCRRRYRCSKRNMTMFTASDCG